MFPSLNLNVLKMYARRWAQVDANIKQITLYRYSNHYEKILQRLHHSVKYCIVFDISNEVLQEYIPVGTSEEQIQEHIKELKTPREITIYDIIEYYQTVKDQKSYRYLMDTGFPDVYLRNCNEEFKREWVFLTRCLAEGDPSVVLDEYEVLFELQEASPEKLVDGKSLTRKIKVSRSRRDRDKAIEMAKDYICQQSTKGNLSYTVKNAVDFIIKQENMKYQYRTVRDWVTNYFPDECRRRGAPKLNNKH